MLSKSPTSVASPVATVWLVDSRTVDDEKLLQHISWLNADELQRYQRFLRLERQRQFLTGRILLRFALGKLLGVAPASISLSERPGHAPLLNWPQSAPGYSISHSGPWVACAVSAHTSLGLDIELLDAERDLPALAEQAFDADVAALLGSKTGCDRVHAFYALWSEKEARYKLASTTGISSNGSCIGLPHADLSIVLCSAQPLQQAGISAFCDW